jgi:hypothetical protein
LSGGGLYVAHFGDEIMNQSLILVFSEYIACVNRVHLQISLWACLFFLVAQESTRWCGKVGLIDR